MKSLIFLLPILFFSCGRNPLDHGAEGGLAFYAAIGLEMDKPALITMDLEPLARLSGNEQSSAATAKRTATGSAFYVNPDGSIRFELWVRDWPPDEDSLWRLAGGFQFNFEYDGTLPSTVTFDTALISRYISFSFLGRAAKTSEPVIDSLELTLLYGPGDPEDWAAGRIAYKSMNMSHGDSLCYDLDFADINTGEQAGTYRLYDGHSFWDIKIFITHQNFSDPARPFRRPGDNAGRITFSRPYHGTGDSLYYDIRFFPPRDGQWEYRTGTVRRGSPGGPLVIQFRKDAAGRGWVDYYGEDGTGPERTTLASIRG